MSFQTESRPRHRKASQTLFRGSTEPRAGSWRIEATAAFPDLVSTPGLKGGGFGFEVNRSAQPFFAWNSRMNSISASTPAGGNAL